MKELNKDLVLVLGVLIVATLIYVRFQALRGIVKNVAGIYIGGIEQFNPKKDVQLSFLPKEIRIDKIVIPLERVRHTEICRSRKMTGEQKRIIQDAAAGYVFPRGIQAVLSSLSSEGGKPPKFNPEFIIITYLDELGKTVSAVFILKTSMNRFDMQRATKRVNQYISQTLGKGSNNP